MHYGILINLGMDAFGMYAQPPPAQNQQQAPAPLFDAFSSNTSQQPVTATASSGSFDFFAASSANTTQSTASSNTDFFAMSSSSSTSQSVTPAFPAPAASTGIKLDKL